MTQEIIVALIVAACAAYLLRRFVFKKKTPRQASACQGGCPHCPGQDGGGCH